MFFLKGFGIFFVYFLFLSCSTIFGQSKNFDIEIDEELKKLLSLKILVNKKITKKITMLFNFTTETILGRMKFC